MLIADDQSVTVARQQGRRLAVELGFALDQQVMVVTVITELTSNMLAHAGRGELLLHAMKDGGRRGIQVVARDDGPGIPNLTTDLPVSYSVASALGLGLKGIRRLTDSLEIITTPGRGTTVTAKKWLAP